MSEVDYDSSYDESFDKDDILCIVYPNDINAIQVKDSETIILHINGSPAELTLGYTTDPIEIALDINNYIHTLNKKTEQIIITRYAVFLWSEVEKLIKDEDY